MISSKINAFEVKNCGINVRSGKGKEKKMPEGNDI